MSYLSDWMDAERSANPDKFDAAMERVKWHHFMQMLRLVTAETAGAVADAADRLEEIFA